MERLESTAPGRVELVGRWTGVDGRRLERPALLLTLPGAGGRLRCEALAPAGPAWTARDGELWSASFAVGADLATASSIELSAGSDVLVALTPPWAPVEPRPSGLGGTSESERLRERLAAAEETLAHEHERRADLEATLDREQEDNRNLRTKLGAVAAELELVRAAHEQALVSSAELEVRATESERRAIDADSRATELSARAAESERRATDLELRATELELRAGAAGPDTAAEPITAVRAASEPITAVRAASDRGATVAPVHVPAAPTEARQRRRKSKSRRARPLNPSLRHRTWWVGRLLIVIVFGAVIAAIVLLISYNHLH